MRKPYLSVAPNLIASIPFFFIMKARANTIASISTIVSTAKYLGMRILHFRIGRQRLSLLTKNLNRPGLPGYSVSRNHRETEYPPVRARRSEEHTSELQSLMRTSYAVFCLKKKNK